MPKSPLNQQSLFFIDKKGDNSKLDHIVQKPIILKRETVEKREVLENKSVQKSLKKVIVIRSNPSSSEEDETETEDETIMFKGHASSLNSSCCEESDEVGSDEYLVTDDESSADSDYISNLMVNNEEYMVGDLQRMNLEPFDSDDEASDSSSLANDADFAKLAKERSFLLKSPSTLLEYSLDETAAEFLSQKNRPRKGKGKAKHQGKPKDSPTNLVVEVDPFEYDGPYTVGAINFKQINREMKAFVNEDDEDEMEMDPMPPLPRKFLHELAHMYGLKSKSTGSGRDRHCVLYKTERSSIPRNVNTVRQLIEKADKAVLWMDKSVTKGKKFTKASVPKDVKATRVRGGKVKARGGSKPGKQEDDSASTKPAVGTVIGQHARPITDDNVGNRLLQKLGWKPGEGLGSASDGMVNPVDAVVRGKRTGLGHSHGT